MKNVIAVTEVTKVVEGQVVPVGKGIVPKKKQVHKTHLGVGKLARQAIMKGYDFESTLAFVKKSIPDTKFSPKCYYWYRHHINIGEYGDQISPAIKKAAK